MGEKEQTGKGERERERETGNSALKNILQRV